MLHDFQKLAKNGVPYIPILDICVAGVIFFVIISTLNELWKDLQKKICIIKVNICTEKNLHFCVSPFLGMGGGYKSQSLDQLFLLSPKNAGASKKNFSIKNLNPFCMLWIKHYLIWRYVHVLKHCLIRTFHFSNSYHSVTATSKYLPT